MVTPISETCAETNYLLKQPKSTEIKDFSQSSEISIYGQHQKMTMLFETKEV